MTLVEHHPAFEVNVTNKKSTLKDQLLILTAEDSLPASGVCNYNVRALQYDQKSKMLIVDLEKFFCPNDRFGKSKGEIYWVAPSNLVNSKTKVCLVINSKKIGVLNLGEKQTRVVKDCE